MKKTGECQEWRKARTFFKVKKKSECSAIDDFLLFLMLILGKNQHAFNTALVKSLKVNYFLW